MRRRMKRTALRGTAAGILALLTAACAPAPHVSQFRIEEPVVTGDPKYDELFARAGSLRTRVEAELANGAGRRRLLDALSLEKNATVEAVLEGARGRCEKLKSEGSRLLVVLVPAPKLIVRKGEAENPDATEFAAAVEDAIRKSIQRGDALDALAREIGTLESEFEPAADGVKGTFVDEVQRDRVALEVDEARRGLERLRLRTAAASGATFRFAVLLAGAVDGGAAAELLAMEASPTKRPPKWKLGTGAPMLGKPAAPAKPAKPKQDFDP
jgi:hypothetical protein